MILQELLSTCVETIKKATSKQKQQRGQKGHSNDQIHSDRSIDGKSDDDDGYSDDDHDYGDDYMNSQTFTAYIVGNNIPLHQLNATMLSEAIRSNNYQCFRHYL